MTAPDRLSRAFHDLRNHLGAVRMNLEVAADPATPTNVVREAAADALRSAADLEKGLEALRDLVRGSGAP